MSDLAKVARQPVEGVLCRVEWFQPADPLWRCEGAVKKQRTMSKEGKPTVCVCELLHVEVRGRQKHLLSRNIDILMMLYKTVHLSLICVRLFMCVEVKEQHFTLCGLLCWTGWRLI